MLARSELENLAQIIMMFTPEGLTIIEEERYLRGRAVQLGLEYNDQTSCEDAISEIARVLVAEGLDLVEINPYLAEIGPKLENIDRNTFTFTMTGAL